MGVHGLWRLLDATGKPVALETLEGKVLAVDVSIWLHQVMQGYQDGRGNPLPNAHLLGLFNRICKLLYYKIKPVFVFDGGVPLLKKNTIASRRKQKSVAASKAQRMKTDLINNLLKRSVVKGALGTTGGTAEKETQNRETGASSHSVNRSVHSSLDLFKLPIIPAGNELLSEDEDDPGSDSDSSSQLSPRKQSKWIGNIHTVNVDSTEFKALPADVRHDILTDLKATRKQNSWGRLHEMPEQSHDFSNYQMKRLLKRRNVQECLEQAEKEMGGKTMTLEELDILLTEQGIATTTKDKTSRIAADNLTRFVYINGTKKGAPSIRDDNEIVEISKLEETKEQDDISDDENVKIVDNIKEYQLDDDWEDNWESSDDQEVTVVKSKEFKSLIKATDINPAMAYMLEHSGLSQEEIFCIIERSRQNSKLEYSDQNSKPGSTRDSKSLIDSKDVVIKEENFFEEVTEMNDVENSDCSMQSDNLVSDSIPEEKDSLSQKIEGVEILSEKVSKIEKQDSEVEEPPVTTISDSDSDDFVEVDEVPLSVVTSFTNKDNPAFEIAIVPELSLEEDIFADVFANIDTTTASQAPEYEKKAARVGQDVKRCEVPNTAVKKLLFEDAKEDKEVPKDMNKTAETSDVKEASEDMIKIMETPKDKEVPNEMNKIEESPVIEELSVATLKKDEEKDRNEEKEDLRLPVGREELLTMQAELENEEKELTGNLGRLERQATDITDQMRLEAQELLRLFGIPYLIAPMEAEAQCAYLELINLTEGTITDDSDIWLFGGRCVYKNFFNLNKHVLQFRATDIRHHFNLSREQMIQLALLVGSDYTIGVSGIGPVTALEILGAFPAEEGNLLRGLTNFRYWIHSGRAAGPGRTSLRTKLKNVHIEKGFPSEAVAQAYLAPAVDESREAFTWNKPNAILLCDFTREKFGWTKNKFEVIFNPIIKRQTEPKKQKGIDSYFNIKVSHKSIEGNLSKRVQKAVQRLGDDTSDSPTPDKRRRKNKGKLEDVIEEEKEPRLDDDVPQQSTSSKDKKDSQIAEFIPQRERDKANALKKKLHAIEVFRKSKKGPGRTKKTKRSTCKIKEKAELSESSDTS